MSSVHLKCRQFPQTFTTALDRASNLRRRPTTESTGRVSLSTRYLKRANKEINRRLACMHYLHFSHLMRFQYVFRSTLSLERRRKRKKKKTLILPDALFDSNSHSFPRHSTSTPALEHVHFCMSKHCRTHTHTHTHKDPVSTYFNPKVIKYAFAFDYS